MAVLQLKHIITQTNGELWIHKYRIKTGELFNVPLLDVPLRILSKYRDDPYCKSGGILLPHKALQNTNAYLKEIATIVGIEKNLSPHTARHTFATLALTHGITMESVADVLGHSDIKTTKRYAKVLGSKVSTEMKKMRAVFDTPTLSQ